VVLDNDVLTFDVIGLAQAFAKRRRIARGGLGRPGVDEADDRHRALLRARRKRRGCHRAAECCDEFTPSKANAHLPLLCLRNLKYHGASL
jgi:hypothetical protein